MTLRLFVPAVTPMMRQLSEMEHLSNALFNPANWGRDITSRETASLSAPVHQTPEGDWKMEVYVDVHKFKPSEVTLTTKDGRMTVEGTAERQNSDGTFHSHHYLKHVLSIPEGVDKEKITAKFTEEGGVLLEAPAQPPTPKEENAVKGSTAIPITHQ